MTRLEMNLSPSKDPAGKNTAPTVKTVKKCNAREAVQHAQGALQQRDTIGQVQSGRAGFGLGDSWTAWGKATLPERRQMVSSFVRDQEEGTI